MSDSEMYVAMREFIRIAVENEVRKALPKIEETLTRSVPKIIEGPPGPAGKDGTNGVDGKPGERGADGANGKDGVGEKGERGADGINGKDGAPSVIPGPKGDTGERGADGIATREELNTLIEERWGELQVRTFADVYQGVYENGRTYERGQLVTWGGSLWLSEREAKTKPGESAEWKLVVKRGADGKK